MVPTGTAERVTIASAASSPGYRFSTSSPTNVPPHRAANVANAARMRFSPAEAAGAGRRGIGFFISAVWTARPEGCVDA